MCSLPYQKIEINDNYFAERKRIRHKAHIYKQLTNNKI